MVNCSGDQENASSHFTPGWNQTLFFLGVIGLWYTVCVFGDKLGNQARMSHSGKKMATWQKNGNLAK